MTKWEYTHLYPYEGDTERTVRKLNDLGDEGWELTLGMPRMVAESHTLILKRQRRCEKCGG